MTPQMGRRGLKRNHNQARVPCGFGWDLKQRLGQEVGLEAGGAEGSLAWGMKVPLEQRALRVGLKEINVSFLLAKLIVRG